MIFFINSPLRFHNVIRCLILHLMAAHFRESRYVRDDPHNTTWRLHVKFGKVSALNDTKVQIDLCQRLIGPR